MKRKSLGMLTMAALLTTCVAGYAADKQGWSIEITPYIWAAGLEGDATINGHETEFEKEVGDLFDAMEVGGSLLTVVQYNRLLLWGQLDGFSLSTDELEVDDRPEGGSLDTDLMLAELAVGVQIDGFAEGQTFDILVGARMTTLEAELTTFADGSTQSSDVDMVDPMLVLRPSIPIFPSKIKGLTFNPTVAIGGGGDSDLVFELFPQIQYQFADIFVARLGYRTVGYRFVGEENEDNELNIRLAGLTAGGGVKC